jgi:hypothetical protein
MFLTLLTSQLLAQGSATHSSGANPSSNVRSSQGNKGSSNIDPKALPLICNWITQCKSTKTSECDGAFKLCGGKTKDPFCSAINSCGNVGGMPQVQNTRSPPRRQLHRPAAAKV